MADELKRCSRCREHKPLSEFNREARSRDGLQGECRDCRRIICASYRAGHKEKLAEADRAYRQANPDKGAARQRRYYGRNRDEIKGDKLRYHYEVKAQVFAHYGTACACCGATDRLSIDHVNGDGWEHRIEIFGNPRTTSTRMYCWLVEHAFPEGFQTLCTPCNNSKGIGPQCRLDHAVLTGDE